MSTARISKTISEALRHVPRGRKRTAAIASSLSVRHLSSYEYPNRTEAPIITRSVAASNPIDNYDETQVKQTSYKNLDVARANHDPFDDANTLASAQRQLILEEQRRDIKTILPSSFSIATTPPSNIPPNLPTSAMITPTTQITQLTNGIRVASQETYGQVTCFGLLSNCGSRLETDQNTGVNHLMELLAFSGTPSLTSTEFQTRLESIGGVSFASSSREQFLYCIDVLRPNVKEAMALLKDVVLDPRLDNETVEEMKRVVEFQWMDIVPELVLGEGLQRGSYSPLDGEMQQLGKSHFCPLEELPKLDAEMVKQFRDENLLNPENLVVAGAGIEHEFLVDLAEEHFGHLVKTNGNSAESVVPSVYTGGSHRQMLPDPEGFTRVALAFPTGGWHSDDLVPACVLQTLLGGGSSFSAGGPGK
jgi:processing peptidase subunit alpha